MASSWPAWDTEGVQTQPEQLKETLSQNKKKIVLGSDGTHL